MAISYILDTSAYSAFNRGNAKLKPFFKGDAALLLTIFVVSELKAGFAAGNQRSANESLLQRFLDSPNVQLILPTLRTAEIFASLFADLRQQGTPIGTIDIWIAASVIEHGSKLVTLDADFKHVKGLELAVIG